MKNNTEPKTEHEPKQPTEVAKDEVCKTCELFERRGDLHYPSHRGSANCRMRTSIAAGGNQAHCACAACF